MIGDKNDCKNSHFCMDNFIGLELYLITRKYKAEKANYRFVVCTQQGTNLVPIDCFNCETDARAHYSKRADTVIVRMTSSDLDWYMEHKRSR